MYKYFHTICLTQRTEIETESNTFIIEPGTKMQFKGKSSRIFSKTFAKIQKKNENINRFVTYQVPLDR